MNESIINEIDAAIEKANLYYRDKHQGQQPPVLLFWSPTSGASHRDLNYFIVWATDELSMGYDENSRCMAYLVFKGMLKHWTSKMEDSTFLDRVEDMIAGYRLNHAV